MPLHSLCCNGELDEATALEILKLLIKKHPEAVRHADDAGELPIHLAAGSKSPEFFRLLIDAYPDSGRSVSLLEGHMPLHNLCVNKTKDEATSIPFLKFLLEKYPEAIRHQSSQGALPIHIASQWRSPECCRVLIKAYPGSVQITDPTGKLPLHIACSLNTTATVEYLYRQYPEAIDHATGDGKHPIHAAIVGMKYRNNSATAAEIVQFLLNCDPNQKLIKFQGWPLLHFACWQEYKDSKIEAAIQVIKVLFDAHPEAIEDERIVSNIHRYHQQVQAFINSEVVYARQANNQHLMNTPDDDGRLPLHTALQNNVRLGSIKLLVKGNPSAVRSPDNSGSIPLHVACQHHDSNDVIQYLIGLDPLTLCAVDRDGNTALHYACRGAKYDAVAMLLQKYDAASVSKRNADDKLPIDLFWESNEVSDRESVDYVGSVFQLVRAYPEMVTISNFTREQANDVDATRHEKKRKVDHDDEE